ncbi:unnamed protein product [Prorocentrum cordatum]|uniref:Uncharacterized protein n=1 Tax=Prorocentrum cordatum TaxID=2364126 RepID=A0ABN9URX4_9DINO|nr:unnamed protein product [Polarella glacialis]
MGAYPVAVAGGHVHGFRGVPALARIAQVLAAAAARMGLALAPGATLVPNLVGAGAGPRPRPGARAAASLAAAVAVAAPGVAPAVAAPPGLLAAAPPAAGAA